MISSSHATKAHKACFADAKEIADQLTLFAVKLVTPSMVKVRDGSSSE